MLKMLCSFWIHSYSMNIETVENTDTEITVSIYDYFLKTKCQIVLFFLLLSCRVVLFLSYVMVKLIFLSFEL